MLRFIQSRSHLYNQVYFHKTNRAANTMLAYGTNSSKGKKKLLDTKKTLQELTDFYLDNSDEYFLKRTVINDLATNYEVEVINELINRKLFKRVFQKKIVLIPEGGIDSDAYFEAELEKIKNLKKQIDTKLDALRAYEIYSVADIYNNSTFKDSKKSVSIAQKKGDGYDYSVEQTTSYLFDNLQSYQLSVQKQGIIPSVNFHLWEPCNMRCKFCFAGFKDVKSTILPKGHLPKIEALKVIEALGNFRFSKISFAGGEPTLCPWLTDLIRAAKSFKMATMLITNGSNICEEYLVQMKGNLDWIVLSIDSLNPETNFIAGRKIGSHGIMTEEDYRSKLHLIRKLGYRLKINTVVHSGNFSERLNGFIDEIKPERWKIMRMLPIEGQNDKWTNEMCINDEQYRLFVVNNFTTNQRIETVAEDNNNMRGSYLMIDPAGRFFDNVSGKHKYSAPILEVGVEKALSQVHYSKAKFISRGGLYDW